MFRQLQRYGANRLGGAYFRDFADTESATAIEQLASTMTPAERRELAIVLCIAAVLPTRLFRALAGAENPDAPDWLRAQIGPLHTKIKALCCLLYFHRNDPTAKVASQNEGRTDAGI